MTLVIAHRGASGYLPEHTLEAYHLAIAQGADFIEPDLVPTRDGVLIARHENELSDSTDVGQRPEFADRRCRKSIDGRMVEGWFAEDFRWAEIQTLRARERLPALRPGGARHDGRYGIPSFAQVIALARDESQPGRRIGIYPETKHPSYFEFQGRHLGGQRIECDTSALLLDTLLAEGFSDPARVFIQSFEVRNLLRLAGDLMPARALRLPLVQLLGDLDPEAGDGPAGPWDLACADTASEDARYPGLARALGRSPVGVGYAALASRAGLRWLAGHVQAVAPGKDSILPRRSLGKVRGAAYPTQLTGAVHPMMAAARALGLAIHPYTLRAESAFLPLDAAGLPLDLVGEVRLLLAAGATGFFTDFPDQGRAAASLP